MSREGSRGIIAVIWRTDFTTFDEEVEYIREWISLRWAFLEAQLASSP